jgi:hypothetical protein
VAAHGLEWLEAAFTPGSSAGHAINATITPNGCRGPALIASRVCDRLQGVTELESIFGDEIRLWPISPRLGVYNVPSRPALMVYLVSVDPTPGITETSLDETEVFIGIVWRQKGLHPMPLYHPGIGTLTALIRGTLDNDPNLSVTVNGQNIQLAHKTRPGRESLFPVPISDDELMLVHELSQIYSVANDRRSVVGQIRSVVQALA